MDLLSLREHHARTLLIHHRWDVEKLLAVLVEKGKACLFVDAGVPLTEDQDLSLPKQSTSTIMCDICMEEIPGHITTRMDCSHRYCNDCKQLFLFFFIWSVVDTVKLCGAALYRMGSGPVK